MIAPNLTIWNGVDGEDDLLSTFQAVRDPTNEISTSWNLIVVKLYSDNGDDEDDTFPII